MILKPTTFDTILQSSTVELLHAHGLAVAPRGRSETRSCASNHDAVGIIGFDGHDIAGRLTFSIPRLAFDGPGVLHATNTTHHDWTRELTNQLMGRIKNRLLQFQVHLRVHIPAVLSRAALELQVSRGRPEVYYGFAALRGEIMVSVDASLACCVLSYSNACTVMTDKDLLLFDDNPDLTQSD